ncbi:MAG: FtsX-like permease family protein [Eubacterium sp.]|nr:FtsX-like permease family protein [Eubacterium sp.]
MLRMLRRDLKRKKTMNTILFLFIIIASMFLASGLNNIITVSDGLENFFNEAGLGDYNILTMGDNAVGALDDMLKTEPAIKDYSLEEVVYASQKNIKESDGTNIEYNSTAGANLIQSISGAKLGFYDENNEIITDIAPGEVYVSSVFLSESSHKTGDTILINVEGVKLNEKIVGICKDAFLGGAIVGNRRFLINKQDYNKLVGNKTIRDAYRGEACYIKTDDVMAIKSALKDVSHIAFDGDKELIRTSYLMDMLLAYVMLIMSVCLIIVSLVILRFSIRFSIEEEFREIGVMKAIGINNLRIRGLYIVKYIAMAVVGAIIGCTLSLPFGDLLLKESSRSIMLKSTQGMMWNIVGAIGIVLICLLFGFLFTGKVNKYTPLDAIRSGQSGERFKKKNKYHLRKTHLKPGGYLALNDVICAPKRFFTIILTFFLFTVLVLVIVNIASTMRSDAFADSFGTVSDMYIMDTDLMMKLSNKSDLKDMDKEYEIMEDKLSDEGIPGTICQELQFKYPITVKGKDYSYTFSQGRKTNMEDYALLEGSAPASRDEIAITPAVAKEFDIDIGDTITVHFANEDIDCMVTEIYETMNNLGALIRLHTDAPTDIEHYSNCMGLQIKFDDHPDAQTIEDRKETVNRLFDTDCSMNAAEYCVDCMKVAPMMEAVSYLLLAITLIIIVLVTILTERTLIAGEVTQIAICKAIGFSNPAIIRWHVWRFAIVGVIVSVFSAGLSIPLTKLFGDPIFAMTGKNDVTYSIDVTKTFFIYPGTVLAVTVIIAFITALYTRKITARDTANIE